MAGMPIAPVACGGRPSLPSASRSPAGTFGVRGRPTRRHRGLRRPWAPPVTAAGAALTGTGREAGHAAASHTVLARSAIAPYVRRMVDRPRIEIPIPAIQASPDADLLYSDQDCIDEHGKIRQRPLFKPQWSPEMLYSANYMTHLNLLRRSLVIALGGFRAHTDGAQDWDIFLRVSEQARSIVREQVLGGKP